MAKKAKKDKSRLNAKKRKELEERKSLATIDSLFSNPDFDEYLKVRFKGEAVSNMQLMNPDVVNELNGFVVIHEMGQKMQRELGKLFTDESVDKSEVTIIDCDMSDVNVDKIKLIGDNIELYIDDIYKIFTKLGVINLKYGDREIKIIFSASPINNGNNNENSLIVTAKNLETGVIFGGSIVDKDMLYGYSFENYVKSLKSQGLSFSDAPYHKYAVSSTIHMFALIFYINTLATTPTSEREVITTRHRTQSVNNRRTDSVPKTEYHQSQKEKIINIPRRFKVCSDSLFVFDENTGTYSKKMGRHSVSGHWRHYKSGKKVWVNEFKRGNGATKTKRKYVVSDK